MTTNRQKQKETTAEKDKSWVCMGAAQAALVCVCVWCVSRCLPKSSVKESSGGVEQVRGLVSAQHGQQQTAEVLVWNWFISVTATEDGSYCTITSLY